MTGVTGNDKKQREATAWHGQTCPAHWHGLMPSSSGGETSQERRRGLLSVYTLLLPTSLHRDIGRRENYTYSSPFPPSSMLHAIPAPILSTYNVSLFSLSQKKITGMYEGGEPVVPTVTMMEKYQERKEECFAHPPLLAWQAAVPLHTLACLAFTSHLLISLSVSSYFTHEALAFPFPNTPLHMKLRHFARSPGH